jgi:phage baseplate assembly protein W
MSALEKKLYKEISVKSVRSRPNAAASAPIYKGFSTVNSTSNSPALYDIALIKQDLINHFHIRQGERLEQPTFGTIIWDMIFEPLTDDTKDLIIKNVEEIINYDPRLVAEQVIVTTYESGIQIECRLTYLPYNIQENLQLRFDQANGLIN